MRTYNTGNIILSLAALLAALIVLAIAYDAFAAKKQYSCQRKTCSQVNSCQEAQYLLNECGMSRLDRDHDGTACDRQCQ